MQHHYDQMEESQQRKHQEYPGPRKQREEYKQQMYERGGAQQSQNRQNVFDLIEWIVTSACSLNCRLNKCHLEA